MEGGRTFSDAAEQGREKFIKGFNKTSDMVNKGVKNLSEGWGNFLRGLRENRRENRNNVGAGSPPITMHGGKKNRRRRRKTRRKKRKTKRRTKRRRRTSKRRKRRR